MTIRTARQLAMSKGLRVPGESKVRELLEAAQDSGRISRFDGRFYPPEV